MKWSPDIIIACAILIGCFAMRFCNINGEVWAMGVLAAGWVFGGSLHDRKAARHKEQP